MVRLVSAFFAVCVVLCTTACAGEQVVADKLAVPEERQQDESLKLIKSVFEKEYRTAKTGKQKRALAEKMLDVSAGTNSDMAAKFVLLRVALDIALEIGDLEIAENTITELDNHFDIDVLEMKCSTYDSLAKSLTERASIGKYANSLKRLISDLIADDRFDEALNFLTNNKGQKGRADLLIKDGFFAGSRVRWASMTQENLLPMEFGTMSVFHAKGRRSLYGWMEKPFPLRMHRPASTRIVGSLAEQYQKATMEDSCSSDSSMSCMSIIAH
ncbi:hypothetical protein UC8_40960 [Roseimaritima ulvae]|uniref:Uncharacterized protein n=1 Tax=Roseimaritima ulvae TaxID=980254 RepID=A0A5B9QY66_9BACT|nr:hypothetical protein [Roseimaritima ulvae]QEG42066.1 hypothetical protein UC8_40960 [Roseimaritima ulvae]